MKDTIKYKYWMSFYNEKFAKELWRKETHLHKYPTPESFEDWLSQYYNDCWKVFPIEFDSFNSLEKMILEDFSHTDCRIHRKAWQYDYGEYDWFTDPEFEPCDYFSGKKAF